MDDGFVRFNRATLGLMRILMDREEDGKLTEDQERILRELQQEFLDAVNRRLSN